MLEKPTILKEATFTDDRGSLSYVRNFNFADVQRFYVLKHPDTSVVRAWQGHRLEKKYFYPVSGSFVVAWVKIDNFKNPSNNLKPGFHILSANNSEIISIPKGYANGLKALEPNSEILVFSSLNLEESQNDRIRYNAEMWFDWQNLKPI